MDPTLAVTLVIKVKPDNYTRLENNVSIKDISKKHIKTILKERNVTKLDSAHFMLYHKQDGWVKWKDTRIDIDAYVSSDQYLQVKIYRDSLTNSKDDVVCSGYYFQKIKAYGFKKWPVLEFNRMHKRGNLLIGDNGSGKTSYVMLLKMAVYFLQKFILCENEQCSDGGKLDGKLTSVVVYHGTMHMMESMFDVVYANDLFCKKGRDVPIAWDELFTGNGLEACCKFDVQCQNRMGISSTIKGKAGCFWTVNIALFKQNRTDLKAVIRSNICSDPDRSFALRYMHLSNIIMPDPSKNYKPVRHILDPMKEGKGYTVLLSILQHLVEVGKKEQVILLLRKCFGFVEDIKLGTMFPNLEVICREDSGYESGSYTSFGSGFVKILYIIVSFVYHLTYMNGHLIVLIDEIENALWHSYFPGIIQMMDENDVQVFITTHSSNLIDQWKEKIVLFSPNTIQQVNLVSDLKTTIMQQVNLIENKKIVFLDYSHKPILDLFAKKYMNLNTYRRYLQEVVFLPSPPSGTTIEGCREIVQKIIEKIGLGKGSSITAFWIRNYRYNINQILHGSKEGHDLTKSVYFYTFDRPTIFHYAHDLVDVDITDEMLAKAVEVVKENFKASSDVDESEIDRLVDTNPTWYVDMKDLNLDAGRMFAFGDLGKVDADIKLCIQSMVDHLNLG